MAGKTEKEEAAKWAKKVSPAAEQIFRQESKHSKKNKRMGK